MNCFFTRMLCDPIPPFNHALTPTKFGNKHWSELGYSFLLYPCGELFILKLLIALTQMPLKFIVRLGLLINQIILEPLLLIGV